MVYSKKRKETQDIIKNAFIEFYRKDANSYISVKDICKRANINRSTFYTYYKDTYDLQDSVEAEIQDKLIGQFKGILGKYETFDVNAITRELIGLINANSDILYLLIRQNKNVFIERILKLAKDGMLFDITDMSEKDFHRLDITLKYHLAGVINVLDYCLRGDNAFEIDDVIGLLAEISDNGAFSVVKGYAFK